MKELKETLAVWIALAVIVGFGVLAAVMLRHVGDSDLQWNRLVFVFGGVEAAGFAGLGFFFGKEVNRARAENAEGRASEAAKRAADADARAVGAEQRAENAGQRLSLLKTVIDEKRAVRAAGRGLATPLPDDDWDEVARIANSLVK